jgi:hypothetical protein
MNAASRSTHESVPYADIFEGIDNIGIGRNTQRVSILPNGTWEKERLLAESTDTVPYQRSRYSRDVLSIDQDLTRYYLVETE